MLNAFDGGPVQPPTIGLDQLVWMTKHLVWDLNQLVQYHALGFDSPERSPFCLSEAFYGILSV